MEDAGLRVAANRKVLGIQEGRIERRLHAVQLIRRVARGCEQQLVRSGRQSVLKEAAGSAAERQARTGDCGQRRVAQPVVRIVEAGSFVAVRVDRVERTTHRRRATFVELDVAITESEPQQPS